MKFSLLIAHYNNWNYFERCYASINEQTFQDFEIVIVDDYSTDGSYEKLFALAQNDSRIHLVRNEENKKVGFTKRRCVELANGEICGFLDPDDQLLPQAIEEAVAMYDNEKTIATYSKIKLINEDSTEIGDFTFTQKIKNNQKYFFNINFEVAHFFTFRKDIYELTEGINSSLTSAVDQDLYLKLYEKGDFYFIDTFQYLYRIHDKGVSQDKSKKLKLNSNWHQVLLDTCKRRKINMLYGKPINEIDNLPRYIYAKENTIFKKLMRKLR